VVRTGSLYIIRIRFFYKCFMLQTSYVTDNKHPKTFTPAEIAKTVTRTGTESTANLKHYCLCGQETVKPDINFSDVSSLLHRRRSLYVPPFGHNSWRHTSQGSVFTMTATTTSNLAQQIPYTRRGSWLFRRNFPFCLTTLSIAVFI